ncbi:MAG: NAD(P)H-dependent oxidoreductase [Coriobacteriia bacterium]|nr:NAD(P)H-dependent oxidoreductase [Coriobacteriia bacterium]MCL2746634.1 NAD(P)H-dependent oxidoreductase [Coriobacteriia bacterium]MCL2870981.1 NAD(P)H-dependent oxidoreductase [Coriobacteriia bacterium]
MSTIPAKQTIGIFAGSLRQDSYSKKVALYLADLLEKQFNVKVFDLTPLSFYNQDLDNENDLPAAWEDLRAEVRAMDSFLFVTPEYNRSVPPVLKNALDIASLPRSESGWDGKPGAIVSISPGRLGGFGANHHLRQVTSILNICMMNQPEMYLSDIAALVDDSGFHDESAQRRLRKFADAFAEWVKQFGEK